MILTFKDGLQEIISACRMHTIAGRKCNGFEMTLVFSFSDGSVEEIKTGGFKITTRTETLKIFELVLNKRASQKPVKELILKTSEWEEKVIPGDDIIYYSTCVLSVTKGTGFTHLAWV